MSTGCAEIISSSVVNPIVTIAIPTFKRGDMLIEAVNSALNQENFNRSYDIIVVDNNPERGDSTEIMMEQYRNNPQISYYKNDENIGPIGNWRKLYELAKGKYVVMLHDDDMIFPYYLQISFSLLENTNYRFKLVYPQYYVTKERKLPNKEIPNVLKYREMSPEDYLVTRWGLPTGLMIDKEYYHKTGGYTEDFYPINDQTFIYKALHIMKGAEIRFPICLYYIGANTSMRPDIIIEGIIQADRFGKSIREDRENRWRTLAPICHRHQIEKQIRWDTNFVSSDIIDDARSKIGIERKWIKDMISHLFSKCLLLYIYIYRIHSFKLLQVIR